MTHHDEQVFRRKLDELAQSYKEKLPKKIKQIDDLWNQLVECPWSDDKFRLFHRQAHSLAGGSSTYGFTGIGDLAMSLDQLCKPAIEKGQIPDDANRQEITTLVRALRNAPLIHQSFDEMEIGKVKENNVAQETQSGEPRAYLLEDDPDMAEYLGTTIRHLGYRAEIFDRVADLQRAVDKSAPDIIVMDIMLTEGRDAGIQCIADIKKAHSSPPAVIFISARNDMDARLKAIRAGGDTYLTKPVDISELGYKLDELTGRQQREGYRVLVIDDDPAITEWSQLILQNAGMSVLAINDPLTVLDRLPKFDPDLILLDLHMPGCSGLELVKLIHQNTSSAGIPIVFLSSEADTEKQNAALNLGAEDFLCKPVNEQKLISVVQSRIRRLRMLSNRVDYYREKDHATGLFNRYYFAHELGELIKSAHDETPAGALLVIRPDNPQALPEKVGGETSASLLTSMASVIRAELQTVDHHVLARISEHALGILTTVNDPDQAVALAESIRKCIDNSPLEVANKSVIVTTSIGVVILDSDAANSEDLIYAANVACETVFAKRGNGVHLHNSEIDSQAERNLDQQYAEIIHDALAQDGFFLVYQPVADLGGEAEKKYDVSLRIRQKSGDVIMPDDFIPAANRQRLMSAIDRWAIERMITVSGELQASGTHTSLCYKLSPSTVQDDTFLAWFHRLYQSKDLQPYSLTFEIGESVARKHLKEATNLCGFMSQLQCALVLGDFGESRDSNRLLDNLPVQYAKISVSHMHDLANSEAKQELVKTVVDIASQHNVPTIAQFVEDANSLAVLWRCGVNYAQGNFLQSAEEIMQYDFNI